MAAAAKPSGAAKRAARAAKAAAAMLSGAAADAAPAPCPKHSGKRVGPERSARGRRPAPCDLCAAYARHEAAAALLAAAGREVPHAYGSRQAAAAPVLAAAAAFHHATRAAFGRFRGVRSTARASARFAGARAAFTLADALAAPAFRAWAARTAGRRVAAAAGAGEGTALLLAAAAAAARAGLRVTWEGGPRTAAARAALAAADKRADAGRRRVHGWTVRADVSDYAAAAVLSGLAERAPAGRTGRAAARGAAALLLAEAARARPASAAPAADHASARRAADALAQWRADCADATSVRANVADVGPAARAAYAARAAAAVYTARVYRAAVLRGDTRTGAVDVRALARVR